MAEILTTSDELIQIYRQVFAYLRQIINVIGMHEGQKMKQELRFVNQYGTADAECLDESVKNGLKRYSGRQNHRIDQVYTQTNKSGNTLTKQTQEISLRKIYGLQAKQRKKQLIKQIGRQGGQSNFSKNENYNVKYQQNVDQYHYLPEYHHDSSRKVGFLSRQTASFVYTLPKRYSQSIRYLQNELIVEQRDVRPYNFSNKMSKIYNNQPSNKLNLFNIFDECGNNGCSSQAIRSNQICAQKIWRQRWK